MDISSIDIKQPTVTRQIAVKETDYQCAKKIVRLVREFDYLQQHLPIEGATEEDRAAICDKFFSTFISQEAFKKLLGQYSQAEGYVDAIMKRLPHDMWTILNIYFDVAEEPSELPMWYMRCRRSTWTTTCTICNLRWRCRLRISSRFC